MAIQTTGIRKFNYTRDSTPLMLDDPNPGMAPEQVLEFYSNAYPELLNGNVTGPELNDQDEIVYNLSFTPKQKG